MWHAFLWALLALLAIPWTLVCMGLHALLNGLETAGGTPDWLEALERWQIPVWLADWLPMADITAMKAWLTALAPHVGDLLGSAPALLGWLVPLVWIGWGLGLVALVMLGVAGSVMVAALRRPPRVVPA